MTRPAAARWTPTAARVLSLHRYPVKSLGGEQVGQLDLDRRGCAGDRTWALRAPNGRIASGKSTRRFTAVPGLLALRAADRDGVVAVTLPDGRSYPVDTPAAAQAVAQHAAQPLEFVCEAEVGHVDDGPVSLLGVASVEAVGAWDGHAPACERFRPNLVLTGGPAFAEEEWVGRRVRIGGAELDVALVSPRCVMVDAATADLPAAPGLLRSIGVQRGACLGVVASVRRPGRVRPGDEVLLSDDPSGGTSSDEPAGTRTSEEGRRSHQWR